MQAKLLRVLEEGEVERIGASKAVHVDVRVVVATHRNLQALVHDGKFRQDLFHRIYIFPLILPPLRERRDDIPALIEHFVDQVCRQNSWKPAKCTAAAITALQNYSWPGNVRELRNMIERLLLLAPRDSNEIGVETVESVLMPSAETRTAVSNSSSGTLAARVENFERETIVAELKRAGFHVTNAAKTLGLERSHLYKKAEQLGIDVRKQRRDDELKQE
jgi:two-component system, NtrC family, nitrogen regulation response regulator NtrX